MNNTEEAGRPNHSVRILAGAFAAAVVINLALLLLIGFLISRRESQQASAPNPQPIDFIRVAPKPEEPKPVEPKPEEPKATVKDAKDLRPKSGSLASGPAKASAGRPRRPGAPKKTGKAKSAAPAAAAPRIDVPEQGAGAPLAPVPRADSRLTAPPSQWHGGKKPEPDDGREASGGGNGSGGRNLVVLHRVPPRYPSRAEARGIEGWVRLEITVSPTGTVSKARVVDASPKSVFDRAALEAIRQWRFKPAFREGRAVEQQADQTVRFRLKKPR